MHDSLVGVCKWLESTAPARVTRESLWVYPFVQLIHFSGLSLWVGTIAIVDLRFLGLAARSQAAAEIAARFIPWTWTGFCIALLGGGLLFSSAASTFLVNPAFDIKVVLIVLGLLWHIVIQKKAGQWGCSATIPVVARLATASELALWMAVIVAAVEIPNH